MLKTFSVTNIGKRRKVNQDYVYTSEQAIGTLPNLFIVADGMGGHNAGDYASRLAVETIVEEVAKADGGAPEEILSNAIQCANRKIRKCAEESQDLEGMGTTVVVASLIDETLLVANVGDSRLYVVNGKGMSQVTKDHSWVEEMVRRGSLGKEEARNHPDKNIITRAVGVEDTVKVDFFHRKVEAEDQILMCTDGLTNMLEDEEIRMIMNGARDIVEKAEKLALKANDYGGRDNISVVLIETSE